jgi:predicted O-methyltransferase YrrM
MPTSLRRRARSAAGWAYRRAAAPFGLRRLAAMQAEGLPPSLVEPLRVLLTGRCPEDARPVVSRIEKRRAAVAASGRGYRFEHRESPDGFIRWVVDSAPESAVISSQWLAHSASMNERWGLFLHLCAARANSRTILELGACIGISGAYLASSPACTEMTTIEASPAIARVARETLSAVSAHAKVIEGLFEAALPRIFERLTADQRTLDLAYVDGHHDELATLRYVSQLAPHMSRGGLMVLDDICLYREMWRAWTQVSTMPGVSAAIHVGRVGVLVFDDRATAPKSFDFSRYTGRWPIGPSRVTSIPAPRLG